MLILPVWSLAIMVFVGCSDEQKPGKFTEEEMASIPLADRSNLPVVSGGAVLSIDTETVTVDEVVTPIVKYLEPFMGNDFETFAQQASPTVRDAVLDKVTGILLYKEARKNAPENIDETLDKAVENEVNKLLSAYGNDYAKAEEAIKNDGMDWQQFRDFKKKVLLTQSYYAAKNVWQEKPITHTEMLQYYEAMKRDDFEFRGLLRKENVKWEGRKVFRLIDIDSTRLAPNDINIASLETPQKAALRMARQLIEKLNDGADFGELAKQYSHGHRASVGGLWTPVTEGSRLVSQYDFIHEETEKMAAGDISGPIERDGHVYIIKLEEKKIGGSATFAELQKPIEYDIQRIRQKERINKLITDLMQQADIPNLTPFISLCVEKAWQLGAENRPSEKP